MKHILHLTQTLTASLLLAAAILAQQPPANSPQLQAALQRLGSAAEAQIHALPSFTCEESATSQIIQNKRVRTDIHVQGTVRVLHKPDGSFTETYTYKRPFHLLFLPRSLPYFVRGGFEGPLFYFLPAAQGCYRYTLTPGRIDFATRPGSVPGHICEERGLKGFALLNAAGDVTQIQRTIPEDVAKPLKLAPFAIIALAPVTLNGQIYLLSQHMIATQPIGTAEGRFEATYSNCKLFTSTVTIGPATEVSPSDQTNPSIPQ